MQCSFYSDPDHHSYLLVNDLLCNIRALQKERDLYSVALGWKDSPLTFILGRWETDQVDNMAWTGWPDPRRWLEERGVTFRTVDE